MLPFNIGLDFIDPEINKDYTYIDSRELCIHWFACEHVFLLTLHPIMMMVGPHMGVQKHGDPHLRKRRISQITV